MRLSTIALLILKNFMIAIKRFVLLNKKNTPYKLLIQLTNDCNSRCGACHIWKINKEDPTLRSSELTLSDYKKIFQEFGNDLFWLALSGGEISLVKDFKAIIDLAIRNCPSLRIITFTTNGLEPEVILDYAQHIKLYNVDLFVNISLDGTQEVHDKIRGVKGNYQSALKTYHALKQLDIMVHYGCTIHNQNSDDLSENYKQMAKEVRAVSFSHTGGIFAKENNINNQKQLDAGKVIVDNYNPKNLAELMEYLYLNLGLYFLKNDRKKLPIPCEVLKTSIHIDPYANVSACMYTQKLGNLRTEGLTNILNGEKSALVAKQIKNETCPKCWMNCYAPHSMMLHPVKTILNFYQVTR
jgi:MoaA/NifB/PqqE/SkfB family radical SAM enzyme